MVAYNLKAIGIVPGAKDFIDIVLSKTQRGTPTVVRNGWAITRVRSFYMRKVKFTAESWDDRLTQILTEFPKVEDIHPFYGDLLNVLYDKDHYKLALGQLNTARNLISRLSQDYVRLMKYGDSLYRCKELKRAAMGRMCTLMKRQGPSLAYLEQVRQHMSRLPGIDPNTRSILLCGYPNVGKSSMMNKLTRADVEVQPYAFTTKSLYVGHMDYKYLRWQVIDTPGILDRPLEERNTIEMQSITALAHLRAAVIYMLDVSEQCGYSLSQQAALFHSIKPLFANKPILIVCNIGNHEMSDISPPPPTPYCVYSADLRKAYDLESADWKYDVMPEIMDGHNVLDFVDADIDARLAELEREEAEMEAQYNAETAAIEAGVELTETQLEELGQIRHRKKQLVAGHRREKSAANNRSAVPHKFDVKRKLTTVNMKKSLGAMGIDTSKAVERARSESRGRKRERSVSRGKAAPEADAAMADADAAPAKRVHSSKSRSMSRGRSHSLVEPRANTGIKDVAMRNKGIKMADKAQWLRNKFAKAGEADRVIQTKMPKHLFSGKTTNGTRDRR
ncbi:MAG: hypothetical protein WDW38_005247 [Sanguina aurantia]